VPHFIFLFEGSFPMPSMKFILSHFDLSSSSSDPVLLEEIVTDDIFFFQLWCHANTRE